MKKRIFILWVLFTLFTALAFGQVQMSFKPPGINGTNDLFTFDLGFAAGSLAPYASFAGSHTKLEGDFGVEYWSDYYDYDDGDTDNLVKDSSGTGDGSFKATVLIPSVGVRLSLIQSDSVSFYLFGSVFKAMSSIEVEGQWTETYYNNDGEIVHKETIKINDGVVVSETTDYVDANTTTTTEEEIGDYKDIIDSMEGLLSPFGGSVGIGAEYWLSEHLAVFGEFCANGILPSLEAEHEESSDWDSDSRDDWQIVVTANMNSIFAITQTSLGLRFRF